MSTPTPFFAPAFIAAMRIRASPHPGSWTTSSLFIPASSIIAGTTECGVPSYPHPGWVPRYSSASRPRRPSP